MKAKQVLQGTDLFQQAQQASSLASIYKTEESLRDQISICQNKNTNINKDCTYDSGTITYIEGVLSQKSKLRSYFVKTPYTAKDIFDLQFGNYNTFLEHVKKRADTDGVLIAGTYLQYFLDNQKNVMGDGLLTTLRQRMSDYDLCKISLRLKQKNLKWLVIDPNILSVVMGAGNDSLKTRMFAKINPVSQTIEQDGVMTMIDKLIEQGYVSLRYSNNLSAKYAYQLNKSDLLSFLTGQVGDPVAALRPYAERDMSQFRAKMALTRFFPDQYGNYAELTARIFMSRLQNGQAISDMADVFGKTIDIQKVTSYLERIEGYNDALEQDMIKNLTSDELFVLMQYMQIRQSMIAGNQQGVMQFLQQIIQSSMGSSSQLMIFEVK